jgi:25S rRNA (uracil2634-N3)-methyltransferase
MGKGRKQQVKSRASGRHASKARNIVKRRQHSQQQVSKVHVSPAKLKEKPRQRPRVPFTRRDNVLLVGEGDFSFALALVQKYKPAQVIATCYDTEDELVRKYSDVRSTIRKLVTSHEELNSEDEWQGLSPPGSTSSSDNDSDVKTGDAETNTQCQVLYGIDAIKLSTAHRKRLCKFGPFSKIGFNFPHTGGLSTDVNRQVRANQELLVGFFNAAKPHLSNGHSQYKKTSNGTESPREGQLVVTLFEGEPYTLWNIRDLARHCGLQVIESFKFPWQAYPGYQHARTIGDITTGKDRADEGKRKGAWRGEERAARCYVLESKVDVESNHGGSRKRGRPGGAADDSE